MCYIPFNASCGTAYIFCRGFTDCCKKRRQKLLRCGTGTVAYNTERLLLRVTSLMRPHI